MTPEGVTLEIDVEPEVSPVEVDVTQLERVVLNLVRNACQAMPHGGVLQLSVQQSADFVVLRVIDSGVGMDAETKRRMFEPFFTTRRDEGGTGLGLAMVHGIVEQSGGRLSIDSEPGRGTRVQVLLPTTQASPRAPRAESSPGRGRGELVLVCEDDAAVSQYIQAALEGNGYRVLVTDSADKASALFEGERRPNLLITDLTLPGASGLVLARASRLRWPGLPVLLCSGYAPSAIDQDLGELPFLAKPFRLSALLRAAREAIDSAVDDSLAEESAHADE
jgi:two-component system cell cycle sensor histidine kinase/response regulator CckA